MLEFFAIGHFAGYYDLGRTEVEPMPADPDFKTSGIWFRYAGYLGSRLAREVRQEELELHLRLAYEDSAFYSTDTCRQIKTWEERNGDYILRR